MKSISVYDIEANLLEEIAYKNEISIAEVVEMLCDYIPDMAKENGIRS